jgi:hypothetical protein
MKKLIVIAILAYAGWIYFQPAETVRLEPGVEVHSEPGQQMLSYSDAFDFKNHLLTPVAEIQIEGKVLGQERYYMDRAAKLSPVDFVLGWKMLSDQSVADQVEFHQNLRWYNWRTKNSRILKYQIIAQSANLHLIPQNDEVKEKIRQIRTGEIVRIVGKLVDVEGQDGWKWKTSTSRNDQGDNASEIVWVEGVDVIKTQVLDESLSVN